MIVSGQLAILGRAHHELSLVAMLVLQELKGVRSPVDDVHPTTSLRDRADRITSLEPHEVTCFAHEASDTVAFGQQKFDQVASDETVASSNQCLHVWPRERVSPVWLALRKFD